jgi:hypothetical protein
LLLAALQYLLIVSVVSPDGRTAMTSPQPRYDKEEHARRGTALYERQMRSQVEAGIHGKVVAIDVDTGTFEVAENTLAAAQRLLTRQPDAQIWCVRSGYPAVHRFGPRGRAALTSRQAEQFAGHRLHG